MTRAFIRYIILVLTITACGSKTVVTDAEKAQLETAVSTPNFDIELQWAYSLSADAGRILNSLNPAGTIANGNRFYIQDGNYRFTIKNDSLNANLPYFGTRQISGGLPGNTGILIDDTYEKWKRLDTKDPDRLGIDLRASQKGEVYDMTVLLSAKGNATITVSSSQREFIRYTGTWQ